MSEIYEQLTAKFDETYPLKKGDTVLDYLTLEQIVTRLNTVLGVDGWDFIIRGAGQDEHHCWVQGQLRAYFATRDVTREQFGECSITRGMAAGDARKGACSDALKKCASLIGVGLYLSSKAERETAAPAAQAAPRNYEEVWQDAPAPLTVACADCGSEIKSSVRKDGSTWLAREKAEYSRNKYGRVLCYPCGQGKAS